MKDYLMLKLLLLLHPDGRPRDDNEFEVLVQIHKAQDAPVKLIFVVQYIVCMI